MKKVTAILCVLIIMTTLLVAFVGCDPKDGKLKPEISFPSSWPENEITANVPELKYGEISYATNFVGADRFYLQIKDITIEDSLKYVEELKADGFVVTNYEEDDNFKDYDLRNESRKCNVYVNIPKGNDSDGNPRNQLGLTITTIREK